MLLQFWKNYVVLKLSNSNEFCNLINLEDNFILKIILVKIVYT